MATPSDLIEAETHLPTAKVYRMNRDDVRRMTDAGVFDHGQKVELIGGLLIAAEPSSVYHSGPMQFLNMALAKAVDERRWVVRVQQPFTVDDYSEPEPDLAVVPLKEAKRLDSHPRKAALLVEVATTSIRMDTRTKLQLYAAAGVPEYWVVDTKERRVLVHRSPVRAKGEYRSVTVALPGQTIIPQRLGAPKIRVADLF